eukprot:337792_1
MAEFKRADYKVVVLGAGTVGKSAITVRMVADTFKTEYDATIEDRYQFDIDVDGKTKKLDILDTAGQEQFAALQDSWIREGDAFLLVYAVNSKATFIHTRKCYTQIQRNKDDARIDLVLIGNKSDLPHDYHEVSYQEGEGLANEWDVPFIMTSAKENINVREAFQMVTREVMKSKDVPMVDEHSQPCCQIL